MVFACQIINAVSAIVFRFIMKLGVAMVVAALLLHSCGLCCYGAGQAGENGHASLHLRQEPETSSSAASTSSRTLDGYTPEAHADVVTSLPGYNASKHLDLDFGLFAG